MLPQETVWRPKQVSSNPYSRLKGGLHFDAGTSFVGRVFRKGSQTL